jgi:hypothetical protein
MKSTHGLQRRRLRELVIFQHATLSFLCVSTRSSKNLFRLAVQNDVPGALQFLELVHFAVEVLVLV